MDKIQELHYEIWCEKLPTEPSKHAAITEDMMGKFAEWAACVGFELKGELWERIDDDGTMLYTTSELIQLFKEQL